MQPKVHVATPVRITEGPFAGEMGWIRKVWPFRSETERYGIEITGRHNDRSASGLFWFGAADFVYVPDKPENCRCSLTPNFETTKEEKPMLPGYKTASIQFLEGRNIEKTYFYALYDESVQPDDTVVVTTGDTGLALAKVVFIGGPARYVTDNREIVCKVDLSAWEDRKAKAEKLLQLKEEMDERVKAYQATALYELAAEKDPDLKALLDMYKSLQEG